MSDPRKNNKSIQRIEEQMDGLEPESLRYRVLDAARGFKSSWIELGQYLFTVYKDKLFRDWGYQTFETYCGKEIGIRQATALKLLKSYSFLETEEPEYVSKKSLDERKPDRIPSFESVNALRLAHANERISEDQYEELREDILEEGKEDAEVKKKIQYILKTGPKKSSDPAEEKGAALKKLTLYLKNYKNDVSLDQIPPKILKKLDELIEVLEDYQK